MQAWCGGPAAELFRISKPRLAQLLSMLPQTASPSAGLKAVLPNIVFSATDLHTQGVYSSCSLSLQYCCLSLLGWVSTCVCGAALLIASLERWGKKKKKKILLPELHLKHITSVSYCEGCLCKESNQHNKEGARQLGVEASSWQGCLWGPGKLTSALNLTCVGMSARVQLVVPASPSG